MTPADATCWTLIHAAAGGDGPARERFARLYQPVARGYLAVRWERSPLLSKLDDAVQDVFVECFKINGVLDKVVEKQPDGFRMYFHGLLRNVALRHESRLIKVEQIPEDQAADDTSLSRVFDRAWARSMLKEAARLQSETAKADDRALKRVELLRLRFQEGLPIRAIAERWSEEPAKLHHEYAIARDEFRAALRSVVMFQMPNASVDVVDKACRELLDLL